jgi:hypothetical protein
MRRSFSESINANQLGDAFEVDLSGTDAATLSVQAVLTSGTWATASIAVQVSNDGRVYHAVPAGAVTLSENGVTALVDVRAYQFAQAAVVTPEGSASAVRVTFCLSDS